MKKVFSLMLLLATMLTFTACSGDDGPEVLKVSFKESAITLQYFQSYTLNPIIESGNIDLSKAVWSSSNEKIATVSDDGVVVANIFFNDNFSYGEGEANISLSYEGEVLATCVVHVTPNKASNISFNHNNLDLLIGETVTLKAIITAEGNNIGVGIVTKLIWKSSDESVATVSNDGEVSALSEGTATITVTDTESGLTAKCNVTVTSIPVTNITCPKSLKMMVGESVQIKATITPEGATNKTVAWTSSNPAVATVDNDGNVYGVALGEAVVTAKTEDGGFEAKCNVKVVELPDMVTAKAIEGYTVSGANSNCHLTLLFETNTNTPVFINSVTMTKQDGTIVNTDYPNEYCATFLKKYITHYFDASGGISGDKLNEEKAKIKGWKFYVQYTWNNNEYTIECINR